MELTNKESLKIMAASGCRKVAFGVETGSERVIKQNGGLGLKNNLSHSSVPKIVILAFIIVAFIPFSSSAQNPAMEPAIEKLKAGQQFQKNSQYDKAIVNYQQALTLFRKLGAEDKIAISLNNIGEV